MIKKEHFQLAFRISPADFASESGNAWLPIFRSGKNRMNDKSRSVCVDPEDEESMAMSLSEREHPVPVFYEHRKGPRGGMAAGKVMSMGRDGDRIGCSVELTKQAKQEVLDGGWYGVSAGITGYRDESGVIHPRELREVSLENDSAVDRLGRIMVFSNGTWEDITEDTSKNDTNVPETDKVSTELSAGEEQNKMNWAELAKLMNLPDGAGETEVKAKLQEEFSAKLEAEAKTKKEEKKADVVDVDLTSRMDALFAAKITEIEAQLVAKYEKTARDKRVADLVELGISDGKIYSAERDDYVVFANADPDRFEKAMKTMPVKGPVKPVVTKTGDVVDIDKDPGNPNERAGYLTKMAQFARERNMTILDAINTTGGDPDAPKADGDTYLQ